MAGQLLPSCHEDEDMNRSVTVTISWKFAIKKWGKDRETDGNARTCGYNMV
jgi:hypothetical protein